MEPNRIHKIDIVTSEDTHSEHARHIDGLIEQKGKAKEIKKETKTKPNSQQLARIVDRSQSIAEIFPNKKNLSL